MDFKIIFDEQNIFLVLALDNISFLNSTKNSQLELVVSDCTYSTTHFVCSKL